MAELATDGRGRRRWPSWLPTGLAWLALFVYGVLLLARFEPALASADGNGYWKQGRLLAEGGRTWFELETPVEYVGFHWLQGDDGRWFSRYPPGLSVAIAAFFKLFGYRGGLLLTPLLALLTVWGVYRLGRRLAGDWWGLAALLVFAANPIVHWHGVLCYSHMAVSCLLVWGFLGLLRWREGGQARYAWLAGLLLGAIPTVRYAEAILAVPVAAYLLLGWDWRRRSTWLGAAAAAGGALLPVAALGWRNHAVYGAFWRTGYGLTNEATAFSGRYFGETWLDYLRALFVHGLGLLLPLGLVGVLLLISRRRWRAEGAFLLLTIVSVTFVYTFYYGSRLNIAAFTLRFLLPTFSAYAVAAAWGMGELLKARPVWLRQAGWGGLVVVQLVWPGHELVTGIGDPAGFKRAFAAATDILEEQIPAQAVIIGHPQFLQHLDYVGKWRLVDRSLLSSAALNFDRKGHDDGRPHPLPAGRYRRRLAKYAGLSPAAYAQAVATDLRDWAGEHPVYWVGGVWELEVPRPPLFGTRQFRVVSRQPLAGGRPVSELFLRLVVLGNQGRPLSEAEKRAVEAEGRQLCLGDELFVAEWLWQPAGAGGGQ